jgi:predicted 3-demethylubiquinone-9 3-methyltransferase (glyoxalase superfamily)
MQPALTTCLWFDDQAEEAMRFYASILPNSRMGSVQRFAADSPGGKKAGDVMVAEAVLMGHGVMGLNGGPMFPQSESFSFQIHCDTQAEIDHYWDALMAGGGTPSQCGWLKDRFGVSWQVVPTILAELMRTGDDATRRRVTDAFMPMIKLDIAAIEAAGRG